jgi:hypothetical protein
MLARIILHTAMSVGLCGLERFRAIDNQVKEFCIAVCHRLCAG